MEGQSAKIALIPSIGQSQGTRPAGNKNNYVTHFNLESHQRQTNMVQIQVLSAVST